MSGEFAVLLARVKSSQVVDRGKAVEELKLAINRQSSTLIDKNWNEIFDALFQNASAERALYIKGTSKSSTRLSRSASAIRAVVQIAVSRLRIRTVKNVLDHIIHSIPTDQGLCEPLVVDYCKTLRCVLEYQPHVEHLRESWNDVMSFCVSTLSTLQETISDDSQSSNWSSGRSGSRINRASRPSYAGPDIDELVACIRQLCRAPNTPLQVHALDAAAVLLKHLKLSTSSGPGLPDALGAINLILARIVDTHVNWTQEIILEMLPKLSRLWLLKSNALKDQILIFLTTTFLHIRSSFQSDPNSHIRVDLERLFETMQDEYASRLARDQLRLDDLQLGHSNAQGALCLPDAGVFKLRDGSYEAESQWMTVYSMAWIGSIMDEIRSDTRQTDQAENGSRKKRRVMTNLEAILQLSTASNTNVQITSLQVLAFMAALNPLSKSDQTKLAESLISLVSHANHVVASWSMLALANCALQLSASDSLGHLWLRVWELASRAIPSKTTARAASLVLDILLRRKLVHYSAIVQSLENMLQFSELTGPGVLAESTVSFWLIAIRTMIHENPGSRRELHEKLLRWMFSKWMPSSFDDRMYATHVGVNIHAIDLLKLMSFCTGKNLLSKILKDQPYPRGILSQSWSRHRGQRSLTDYLLLSTNISEFLVDTNSEVSKNTQFGSVIRSDRDPDLFLMLMEFCSAEANRSLEKLHEIMTDRSHRTFSAVLFRLLSILCLVNDRILAYGGDKGSVKWHEFGQNSEKLSKMLSEDLSKAESEQAKLDTVLTSVSEVLPDVASFDEFAQQFPHPDSAVSFMTKIYKSIKARRHTQTKSVLHESLESMDLDDEFNSQSSQALESQSIIATERDRYYLSSDITSFRSSLSVTLAFITITTDSARVEGVSPLTSEFMQHLNQLSAQDLVTSWKFVRDILSSSTTIKGDEVSALLEHVTDVFLSDYNYERHEVALTAYLDLLGIFAMQWTDDKSSSTADLAADAYEWFINIAVKNSILSQHVCCGIVDLMFILLQQQGPEFKALNSIPTTYSIILQLIDCELPVRAYLARKLPRLFDHFTLGEHESVFQAIFQRLPLETNWTEGMAVRLLFLAEMGSSWHTLLRRCVYHIFEAAGKVTETKDYAAVCIGNICSTLSISNEQELFKFFAPQLLYTWLKESSWDSIPYSVFNFESLKGLLDSVEDEAVGQSLIHSGVDGLKLLSDAMERSVGDILMNNLARAAAYSFAADSQLRSTNNTKGVCESRLKSFFDSQSYVSLLQAHYPLIISILFATIKSDEESSLIKLLSKDSGGIGNVSATLSEIRNFSSSLTQLPADQQPNFKPIFLLENIERLCRRIGRSNETLWNESLFVFVLRYLLQRIQPSLGSLHACTMLRKIRLLVAISGKVPFSGYPLEMMLHALQPFLINHLCTEDAIGIVQYLLNPGVSHLPERVPFVTGFVAWNLLSLRRFCETPHDSTTQESEYRSTLSKVETFRTWLYSSWCPRFVSTLQSMNIDSQQIKRFQLLMDTAAKVESIPNATISTSENALIKAILVDQQAKDSILTKPVREAVLALLCENFEPPTSYRDDIFGTDAESVEFAIQIWDICRSKTQISDNFLIWAGRVLGRARNSSNELEFSKTAIRPTRNSIFTSSDSAAVDPDLQSVRIILKATIDVISSTNHNEIGFSEQTLRQILSKDVSRVNIEKQIGSDLPLGYYKALRLSTIDMPISLPSFELITWDGKGSFPKDSKFWLRDILLFYTIEVKNDLLRSITILLSGIQRLSVDLFAPILHLILLEERLKGEPKGVKAYFSKLFNIFFQHVDVFDVDIAKTIIRALLYLREQPSAPLSVIESLHWLELDYVQVSRAAELCGMHTTALLFAESVTILDYGQTRSQTRSRQSLKLDTPLPNDLLLSIYRNIEEPDSFYGVHQSVGLDSVLELLEYENDGTKSLLFHGARLDSEIRNAKTPSDQDISGVCKALSQLNLNSLALSVLRANSSVGSHSYSSDMVFRSARKLEQWDISIPETAHSESAELFNVFQTMNSSTDATIVKKSLNSAILTELKSAFEKEVRSKALHASFRHLGVLSEMDEVFSSRTSRQIEEVWARMLERNASLPKVQFENATLLLSCRENLFNIIASNKALQLSLEITEREARSTQIMSLLESCKIVSETSLATVTYLYDLMPICQEFNLAGIETSIMETMSDVLWSQGEQVAAINVLQNLTAQATRSPSRDHSKSTMLAKLGHHIAEARLESAEEITRKYLEPALKGLKGNYSGEDAGRVLHEFAVFCDNQLHNSDFIEEFGRVSKAREKRKKEVDAYHSLIKASKGKPERERYLKDYHKSKRWYDLDDEEYNRMAAVRQTQIVQCFENYLRSLATSGLSDGDVLRFFSVWLENKDNDSANIVVAEYLPKVPSAKFAILMNQLTSILEDQRTHFHAALTRLIKRICIDHPYHSLHNIFTGVQAPNGDENAQSRKRAMKAISSSLQSDKSFKDILSRVFNADSIYHALAVYKDKSKGLHAGLQVALDALSPSATLLRKVPDLQLPPPTMSIPLRADGNYSDIPHIVGFRPRMTIASGISAPKIVTAIASNGLPYKQLFKGGSDDLRQDAIMEQVFDQVNQLLKSHAPTRQRKLHIRTYKVLPLTATSGIIEFVQNTIPLSDYLQPAHEKYYPENYRWSKCRDELSSIHAQTKDPKSILKVYKKVTENFHPVLHFFFLERFLDPDEWFENRLAYTRSTATISMLGHVLGLGDRHCHNILLDQKTGEAIHIDLGIAFENGRILPVPEVVPFRLSRDIVSAMGYTKTEGVFRRCCEFTLNALREERENIMTLLNVLKYDPLVTWTVSPLRAKRMQEQEIGNKDIELQEADLATPAAEDEEGGQAERALRVVEKKLSKVLSTAATVSELIQQASDERNLAVLYPGWAPWA